MQALRRLSESLLLALCITVFQGCEEPVNLESHQETTAMQHFTFIDDIQAPTELKVGDVLRWYDSDEDMVVLCFRLDPAGQRNYGEFIVMRKEFEWDDLNSTPTMILTEDDLEWSDIQLGNPFIFSSAQIAIEHLSDSEDMVQATITGTAVDENDKVHEFRLSSKFHIIRREKHAEHWRLRLTDSMADRFPSHSTIRHYTESSDYGLRYGNDYLSEFTNADGETILIQLVFDSPNECDIYVASPGATMIDDDDRTFGFTEAGLEKMTAYIRREITER